MQTLCFSFLLYKKPRLSRDDFYAARPQRDTENPFPISVVVASCPIEPQNGLRPRPERSRVRGTWDEAIEDALDLLHARVFQRCLEDDLESIMHMGAPVAYIRKFDSKL